MKTHPFLYTLLIAAFCLGFVVQTGIAGAEDQHAPVEIDHPYAFATTSTQKNGVVLFTIHNMAEHDLRITSAHVTPDIADRAELHTHIMDGDKMMMRQVEGYDIPEQGSITLSPMGDHIMLMDLLEPLEQGSHITLTLGFEDGSMTQIDVPVIAPGTKPEGLTGGTSSEHDSHSHSHDHNHAHEDEHDHQDHSHH